MNGYEEETLLARSSHRLERLYSAMQESHHRGDSERTDLQSLVSDISHQTIVMITHNMEIAQLADRIVRIEDGRIAG